MTELNVIKERKKAARELIEAKAKEESRIVKGRFKNLESAGAPISFWFRKHPTEQLKLYKFADGEIGEVPLSVARHLTEQCYRTVHKYAVDHNGKSLPIVGQRNHRFAFMPLDFVG